LTEKRMICSFEKKNDFEQTLISKVLSFAWYNSSILWKSDFRRKRKWFGGIWRNSCNIEIMSITFQ
jgi:hypothetical protein